MRKALAFGAAAVIAGLLTVVSFPGGTLAAGDSAQASPQGEENRPRLESHMVDGRIHCQSGTLVVPRDLCHPDYANSGTVRVPSSAGDITGALFVLDWTPSLQTTRSLALVWPPVSGEPTVESSGEVFKDIYARGDGALWVRIDSERQNRLFYRQPIQTFGVMAAWTSSKEAAAGDLEHMSPAVVAQDYTLCVVWAYNGAELPERCPSSFE